MQEKQATNKTDWHGIFGTMLQLIWQFADLTVHAHYALMSQPPQGDFVLIRNETGERSKELLDLLPDGIQQSSATHIILELKYTESLNVVLLRKTLGYDTFYKDTQKLTDTDVQTFIVSVKTPRKAFLKRFGYEPTDHAGVYISQQEILQPVQLILLNQLSAEPNNAFFKCFASRQKEREKAFGVLKKIDLDTFPEELSWFMAGLINRWPGAKGDFMETYNAEKIIELGKMWAPTLIGYLDSKEVLSHYQPEERVAGLKPEERVAGLKPEERVAGLKAEERVAGLKAEEVMQYYKPEERLAGMSIEDIRAYLKRQEQKNGVNGH